jgi:hypothetical protein
MKINHCDIQILSSIQIINRSKSVKKSNFQKKIIDLKTEFVSLMYSPERCIDDLLLKQSNNPFLIHL